MQYQPQPQVQYMVPQQQALRQPQYQPMAQPQYIMPPQPTSMAAIRTPPAKEGFLNKLWDHTPFGWAYNSFFASEDKSATEPSTSLDPQTAPVNTGGRRVTNSRRTEVSVAWKNVVADLARGKRILTVKILEAANGQNPHALLDYAFLIDVPATKIKRLKNIFKKAYIIRSRLRTK